METEKKFLVDLSFLNQIAEYLAGRPYREVAPFMSNLAKLTPYEVAEPIKDESDPEKQV